MEKEQYEPLQECYCTKCGKEFYPTPVHIYKDYNGRYCSWTCFNHRNDGKPNKPMAVECVYPETGEVAKTFPSATKAAEWIGAVPKTITRALELGCESKGYLWRYKQ